MLHHYISGASGRKAVSLKPDWVLFFALALTLWIALGKSLILRKQFPHLYHGVNKKHTPRVSMYSELAPAGVDYISPG